MARRDPKLQEKKLLAQLQEARSQRNDREVADTLAQLENINPEEAVYAHHLGDALLKLTQREQAVAAYERAVERYAKGGFLARAMAMAKTLLSVDPSRTDVLTKLEQHHAQEIHRRSHPNFALPPSMRPPTEIERPRSPLKTRATTNSGSSATSLPAESDVGLSGAEFQLHELAGNIDQSNRSKDSGKFDDPLAAERLALLPLFPLFSEAPQGALAELARRAELVICEGAKRLVRCGDPATGMYGIVEGKARVVVPGLSRRPPILLGEGEIFGESCLLNSEPRRADVFADQRLVALYFSKRSIDELVAQYPKFESIILGILSRRLLANFIQTSPLFAPLAPEIQLEIAKQFRIGRAPAGTKFISVGQSTPALFIPLTGTVALRDAQGPRAGRERRIRPGTAFGHESLLGQPTLPYDAIAVREMLYLRLDITRFETVVSQHPPFREHLCALPLAATRTVA